MIVRKSKAPATKKKRPEYCGVVAERTALSTMGFPLIGNPVIQWPAYIFPGRLYRLPVGSAFLQKTAIAGAAEGEIERKSRLSAEELRSSLNYVSRCSCDVLPGGEKPLIAPLDANKFVLIRRFINSMRRYLFRRGNITASRILGSRISEKSTVTSGDRCRQRTIVHRDNSRRSWGAVTSEIMISPPGGEKQMTY